MKPVPPDLDSFSVFFRLREIIGDLYPEPGFGASADGFSCRIANSAEWQDHVHWLGYLQDYP